MKLLRQLARWIRGSGHDPSLAEELEEHRARIQEDLEAGGMPRAEAAAASRRTMGNVTLAHEEAHDVWVVAWIDRLWRDVRFGLRGLRREPVFAATAILILALGVGTTTTVFSVADAELWKPLPLPHPEQLVAVDSKGPGDRASFDLVSGADLLDWRAAAPAFSDLAGLGRTSRGLLQRTTAESVLITSVTPNYFTTLGRPALAGRTFNEDDVRASHAALLSERGWQRLFARDPAAVGQVIMLDAEPTAILGVVRTSDLPDTTPDLFVAIDERGIAFLDRAHLALYGAIGRLRPGATPDVARAQLQAAVTRLAQADPTRPQNRTILVDDMREASSGFNWRALYFFLAASLLVLLLSAVNVASLVLARTFRRTPEFALRGALGGVQRTFARQLLVEGALIVMPGGAIGLVLTTWLTGLFAAQLPPDFLERGTQIPMDLRVGAFALLVTGATTLAFMLAPLVLTRRLDLTSALGSAGRTSASPAEGRARRSLLVMQIALTMVLLASAGLFLESFAAVLREPLGFDPANAFAARAVVTGTAGTNDVSIRAYAAQALDAARAVPGVDAAAVATSSPLGSGPLVRYAVTGDPPRPAGDEPTALMHAVSPGYFQLFGIRLEKGREFSASDVDGAPRVAVVNQTLATRDFGDVSPIGREIELPPGERVPWTRRPGRLLIVGVAANVKEVGLAEVRMADIYVPFAQAPAADLEVLARAKATTPGIANAIRKALSGVNPSIPVTSISTFDDRVRGAVRGDRFNVLLIGAFASLALLLSAVGIYGAIAYSLHARTRELGVRLALGARPATLVAGVLWHAGRLGALGGALGLATVLVLAVPLGNALYLVPGEHDGLLFKVSTTDPLALVSAFAGVVIVALLAGAAPARRAGRVDVIAAIRDN